MSGVSLCYSTDEFSHRKLVGERRYPPIFADYVMQESLRAGSVREVPPSSLNRPGSSLGVFLLFPSVFDFARQIVERRHNTTTLPGTEVQRVYERFLARVREILDSSSGVGGVVFEKRFSLTKNGLRNLLRYCYGNAYWLWDRSFERQWLVFDPHLRERGARRDLPNPVLGEEPHRHSTDEVSTSDSDNRKVTDGPVSESDSGKDEPLHFFVVSGLSQQRVDDLKDRIRKLLFRGYLGAIHTPSYPEEVQLLSQMVLNDNSLRYLNTVSAQDLWHCNRLADVVRKGLGVFRGRYELGFDSFRLEKNVHSRGLMDFWLLPESIVVTDALLVLGGPLGTKTRFPRPSRTSRSSVAEAKKACEEEHDVFTACERSLEIALKEPELQDFVAHPYTTHMELTHPSPLVQRFTFFASNEQTAKRLAMVELTEIPLVYSEDEFVGRALIGAGSKSSSLVGELLVIQRVQFRNAGSVPNFSALDVDHVTAQDVVYDSRNYGYCGGLKFLVPKEWREQNHRVCLSEECEGGVRDDGKGAGVTSSL